MNGVYKASGLPGKRCHTKKSWISEDVLDICDERGCEKEAVLHCTINEVHIRSRLGKVSNKLVEGGEQILTH